MTKARSVFFSIIMAVIVLVLCIVFFAACGDKGGDDVQGGGSNTGDTGGTGGNNPGDGGNTGDTDGDGGTEHTHTWTYGQTNSTCVVHGEIYRECAECGEREVTETLPLGSHIWGETQTLNATCGDNGKVWQECINEGCTAENVLEMPLATGAHVWGDYHYDPTAGNMISKCLTCDATDSYAVETTSQWVGSIYNLADYEQLLAAWGNYDCAFEAEDAKVAYKDPNNADATDEYPKLNNGDSYIELNGEVDASGGALVENISNYGNYVEFTLEVSRATDIDIALKMANTNWTQSNGIGELNPLGKYNSFYIDGVEADLNYCKLPGSADYNYYDWTYFVLQDIALDVGTHTLTFKPKDIRNDGGGSAVCVPNLDVMYIWSADDTALDIRPYCTIAAEQGGVADEYATARAFEQSADKEEFTFNPGTAMTGDLVFTVNAATETDLTRDLWVKINKIHNVEVTGTHSGTVSYVIRDVTLDEGVCTFGWTSRSGNVGVQSVTFCSAVMTAEIDAEYDYYKNPDNPDHKLTVEAEDNEVERVGGELENKNGNNPDVTEKASGGEAIGSMSNTSGAYIKWVFDLSGDARTDIVIRLACAYWDKTTQNNKPMYDLSNFVEITVNGKAVDISSVDLTDTATWQQYEAVVIKGLNLKSGENEVVYKFKSTACPNVDCLYVFSGDGVTASKVGKAA